MSNFWSPIQLCPGLYPEFDKNPLYDELDALLSNELDGNFEIQIYYIKKIFYL